ncbi:MAG: phosphoribosylformylglycinamidine cyclo-ligase [Oscillospiraceae bacterium]|nr:phosphoribosylformylglycinamidine cyclo-ligase [Oscillospiraceae bacterium]
MLDNKKMAAFISAKRRAKGLTQQQVAEKLHITFQAVSKWESGLTFPNTELLVDLSQLLGITVDEMLRGQDSDSYGLTYSRAGVDIIYTDTIKSEMNDFIDMDNPRVLNGIGAFASLYDIKIDNIKNPVLVLKAEVPGTKQKLAMEYGYTESICHDMINHLVNDIIVMGAMPLAVLDTIVCGSAEKETIKGFVKNISDACKINECALVGGETSVQPNVFEKGAYILTASIAGIVDRDAIIDGSEIQENDVVLAVASNGLHTNGYSLVRLLMNEMPEIKKEKIGGESFIEAIMKPHTSYYKCVKDLIAGKKIRGMAHITGGGIEGNLHRIIPDGLCANVDLSKIKILPIFKYIKDNGNISDIEMLNLNCGVGLIVIAAESISDFIVRHISRYYKCYAIGKIISGNEKIKFDNRLKF